MERLRNRYTGMLALQRRSIKNVYILLKTLKQNRHI